MQHYLTIISYPNICKMCIEDVSGDRDDSGAAKRMCATRRKTSYLVNERVNALLDNFF